MLGFGAIGQLAIGEVDLTGAAAETITLDKWYIALSEPIRFRAGLAARHQLALTLNPQPFVSFGWFGALTEPVRHRPRNPSAIYQDLFWQPAPSPFVATGWYMPLTEPVRLPNGLKVYLQRTETQSQKFIPEPFTLIEGWYNWLNEPVRKLRGLEVQYQRENWSPERTLPNPNITATINAIEINSDKVSIIVNIIRSNPVVSAKVSISEIGTGLSFTSIIESS